MKVSGTKFSCVTDSGPHYIRHHNTPFGDILKRLNEDP